MEEPVKEQVHKKNCENSDICQQIIGRQGLLKPYFSINKIWTKVKGVGWLKVHVFENGASHYLNFYESEI